MYVSLYNPNDHELFSCREPNAEKFSHVAKLFGHFQTHREKVLSIWLSGWKTIGPVLVE